MSRRGSEGPGGPRDTLSVVRRSLFRLHKTLIDAERRALERERGTVSSGEFLQVLIHDARYEWLQPFTTVIVEVDEALARRDELTAEEARFFLHRIQELAEPPDHAVAEHYAVLRQSDPDVLIAHVELTGNLWAALE